MAGSRCSTPGCGLGPGHTGACNNALGKVDPGLPAEFRREMRQATMRAAGEALSDALREGVLDAFAVALVNGRKKLGEVGPWLLDADGNVHVWPGGESVASDPLEALNAFGVVQIATCRNCGGTLVWSPNLLAAGAGDSPGRYLHQESGEWQCWPDEQPQRGAGACPT